MPNDYPDRGSAIRRLTGAVRAAQTASDAMDQAFADFVGINRTDARCLDIIDQNERITAGDLAREIGLTSGAVTAIVDRLEAARLVQRTRDEADRRKIFLEMTPEAESLGSEIYGPLARAARPYLEQLTDEQIATITAFLEVSRRLNLEHARAVAERTMGKKVSLRRRLEQARQIRDDAKGLLKAIKADVKETAAIVRGAAGRRWVRDEEGRWVEVGETVG